MCDHVVAALLTDTKPPKNVTFISCVTVTWLETQTTCILAVQPGMIGCVCGSVS